MIIKHMQRNILWGKSKSEIRKAKRTRCEGKMGGKRSKEALAVLELFILAISFLSIKCCRKSQSRTHTQKHTHTHRSRKGAPCVLVCVRMRITCISWLHFMNARCSSRQHILNGWLPRIRLPHSLSCACATPPSHPRHGSTTQAKPIHPLAHCTASHFASSSYMQTALHVSCSFLPPLFTIKISRKLHILLCLCCAAAKGSTAGIRQREMHLCTGKKLLNFSPEDVK